MLTGEKATTFFKVIFCFILIIIVMVAFYIRRHPGEEFSETGVIRILWAEWEPAKYLQELSKEFTRETGIQVIVETVPWSDFQKVFFNEAKDKGQKYDMVGGDSQWLGMCAVQGHYVQLTSWFKKHEVDKIMTDASIQGYSEYPKGSGKYWAIPLEGDAMGFAYREDLFQDPEEKKAFKEKYGYDLNIPKTWYQLRDIAEFFYRPEEDFYGITVWCEDSYDGTTMGVQTFIWAWGSDLGDYDTFRVKGILNIPQGAEALKFYKSLYQFSAPEWKHAYLDANEGLKQGRVAMVMSYFAFFPELLDPSQNPYAEVTGFFANPGGPAGRFCSLGGQGLSVVSYSKKKDFCFKFLEWFIREDVQQRWADLGGYTCSKNVLRSDAFLEARAYNRPLMESMQIMRDFWVVPEYSELLEISQNYWYEYLTTNKYTAEEVMDLVAGEWENIFEYSGYYKE